MQVYIVCGEYLTGKVGMSRVRAAQNTGKAAGGGGA